MLGRVEGFVEGLWSVLNLALKSRDYLPCVRARAYTRNTKPSTTLQPSTNPPRQFGVLR